MKTRYVFRCALLLLLSGCGYTVLNDYTANNTPPAGDSRPVERPDETEQQLYVADKFNFEYRRDNLTLNTLSSTLSGSFPYGHSGSHHFHVDRVMMRSILKALKLTDYANYDYYPSVPDKRTDRFLYFELGGKRVSLRWYIPSPANEHETRMKAVETLIDDMISSSADYQRLYRPDPPPAPRPVPPPVPRRKPHHGRPDDFMRL